MNKFGHSMSSCMHIFDPELQHSIEADVEGLLPTTHINIFISSFSASISSTVESGVDEMAQANAMAASVVSAN